MYVLLLLVKAAFKFTLEQPRRPRGKVEAYVYSFFNLGARLGGWLTLNLPMTTIVAQPFNVIKWQLKFNPVA